MQIFTLQDLMEMILFSHCLCSFIIECLHEVKVHKESGLARIFLLDEGSQTLLLFSHHSLRSKEDSRNLLLTV